MNAKPYTVAAAARYLGVTQKIIREHIRAGRLMVVPGVSPTLIDPNSVEAMKQQRDKSNHPVSRNWAE